MLHKAGPMRGCIVVASYLTGMELSPCGCMTKDHIGFTRCQCRAIARAINPKRSRRKKALSPGGGNLVVRHHVFTIAGQFSTELGPHGHDLGGGEDSEYVLRAMIRGVRCQYTPDIHGTSLSKCCRISLYKNVGACDVSRHGQHG